MKKILLFIYIILISSLLEAKEIIKINNKNEVIYLSFGFEMAVDKNNSATIKDISNGELIFHKVQLPYSGPHTSDTIWFRFTLQQKENKLTDRLLIIEPRFIDRIELYSLSKNNKYGMKVKGDTIPGSALPFGLMYSSHSFNITLNDDKPHTFYLKIKSHDVSILNLKLTSHDQFNKFNSILILFSGFILGALTLIVINAFNMWRWLKKTTYLFVIGYAMSSMLNQIILNGLIPQYLWPNSPSTINLVDRLSVCLQPAFFSLFVIYFYESKKRFPYIHYLVLFILSLSIITIISIPFDLFPTLARYLAFTSLCLLPVLLYISWAAKKTGFIGSHTVFLGSVFYVLIVVIHILSSLGMFPFHPMVMYIPTIGSLIFVFTMQQGMYRQVNQFEIEKIAAEIAANEANKKADDEKTRRAEQSTFMTMVAHEIHTPLAVIDSAIQTIGINNPNLAPFISDRHKRIQNSISLLNQLLENTLAAESSESRPLQPKFEQINTEEFISLHVKNSLSKEKIYTLDIEPDSIITADPKLLKHIISNLLVNAEKYSPKETPIFITVEKQERKNQLGIAISVKNSHFSDKMIEPSNWLKKYFRQTDTPNINGFGLGLYLVKKITEAHQGGISIDIQPTSSSFNWLVTISVWLPNIRIEDHI